MNDAMLEIIAFTDPVCSWCWGSEPVLRKLEHRYGDALRISFVMGGLVEDIRHFYDPTHGIGRDPEKSNRAIADHWAEGAQIHGMPVRTEGFRLFSDEFPSTWPQNIAVKAVQLAQPERANSFLRRLREATLAEAQVTSRPEVLLELASEVGVDLSAYLALLESGRAEQAFAEDRALARRHRVAGFPSFLVRYGDKELMLRSFQTYESFQAVIRMLTGGALTEHLTGESDADMLEFVKQHGRVAPIELSTAFDLTRQETDSLIARWEAEGACRQLPAGNDAFVQAVAGPEGCSAQFGRCSI